MSKPTSEAVLKRKLALKKKLLKDLADKETGKIAIRNLIIHSVEDTSYPNCLEPEFEQGISSWFKAQPVGFYHNGIEIYLSASSPRIIIDKEGNWADINKGQIFDKEKYQELRNVVMTGKIPYSNIVDYDPNGDEYEVYPHIYCSFSNNGEPYESFGYIVLDKNMIDGQYRLSQEFQFQYNGKFSSRAEQNNTESIQNKHIEITSLITKIQSREYSLSKTIAEILSFASRIKDESLVEFCKRELVGWKQDFPNEESKPKHRMANGIVYNGLLNPSFWENSTKVWIHLEQNGIKQKFLISQSVSELESEPPRDESKFVQIVNTTMRAFGQNSDDVIYIYFKANNYWTILEQIKTELTGRLINLMSDFQRE